MTQFVVEMFEHPNNNPGAHPLVIPDGLSMQEQIHWLVTHVTNHAVRLDEIEGSSALRELVTRIDRVIVKNLFTFVGPLELNPPGTPIVLETISGRQLFFMLRRQNTSLDKACSPLQ